MTRKSPIPSRKSAFSGEVGVISVGFGTVELMVVRDRTPVQRFTSGSASGVRRLLEIVNGQHLYSLGEMDTQLRAGQLDVSTALPVWEREVTGVIEKQWGTAWKRFAVVLLMGGGSVLLHELCRIVSMAKPFCQMNRCRLLPAGCTS